ncbi:MAG: hypothetical protein PHG85_03390 [Candidatus Altiarchaeota archaeon]|nr:hypothetical protein [Candidatus Altiarchaeota archaeon]
MLEQVDPGSTMIFLTLKYDGDLLRFKVGDKPKELKRADMIGFINARGSSAFTAELAEKLYRAGRHDLKPDEAYKEYGSMLPPSYEELCRIKDSDKREVGFLMLVHVDQDLRGLGMSGRLLRKTLEVMRDKFHLDYAVVYGRLPNLSNEYASQQEADKHLQEYVARKRDSDGMHPDWAVRFHQHAGCQVVCGIPNYSDDKASFNHGFVGVYDLAKLRAERRI